jgi:O-antigen ligase
MPQPIIKYNRTLFAILFICLVFIGLVTKRAVMSIGMIALFISSLINSEIGEKALKFVFFRPFPLEGFIANTFFYPDYKQWWKQFWSYKAIPAVCVFILPVMLSGLWSEHLNLYWKTLVLNAPFLFLPFAIGSVKPFSVKTFTGILYAFIGILFLSSLFVMGNYALHFDEINESIRRGSAIPVPHHEHIRYSLMLVFACTSACYLLLEDRVLKFRWEKYLQTGLAAYFILVVHLLSVRSGLLALYVCLAFGLLYFVIQRKKYLQGIIAFALLLLFVVGAFAFIPSLKNKLSYMDYDLNKGKEGQLNGYSDAGRLQSIRMGIQLIKTAPILGLGAGDLKPEMDSLYKHEYPSVDTGYYKLPHNQFVFTWGASGVLGMAGLLFSMFFPWFYKKNYKDFLLTSFLLIAGTSLMFEHTLETQVGIAFYLVLFLSILNYRKHLSVEA